MSQSCRRRRVASSRDSAPAATSGKVLLAERPLALQGEQILGLGGDQLRTVEREEFLALGDPLPRGVHEELVDPAFQLDVDMGQAAFIDLHLAHGADRPVQGPSLGEFELHPDRLEALGAQRHRILFGQW